MTAQLDLFADEPDPWCCITCDAAKRWGWGYRGAGHVTGQSCQKVGWQFRFPHYLRAGQGLSYVGPLVHANNRAEGPLSPYDYKKLWWALSWYVQQTEPIT